MKAVNYTKTALLALTLSLAPAAWSQTALGPRPPALQPVLVLTNQFGTNIFPTDLAAQLVNLQTELEQILPVLAAFNDSFDFVTIAPPAIPVPAGTTGTPAVGPAVNLGTDLSQNLSTVAGVNLGSNLGANLGVSTSGAPALTPPTVVTTPTPEVGLVPTLDGPSGAVGFNSARDALRALLILQNDVERMLPIVATVNLSTNSIAAFQAAPIPSGTIPTALNPTTGR